MPSPVPPRKTGACAGKWRFVSALCLYCSKFPGGIQPAARAEFEKSDSPGKSDVGIGVFRTIAALGYHRGTQPMASPLAITSPMAVMASSAAFAALLFPQAQRDRHRQSARTMETNFFMLDPHSLSCAAAEKRNSARRNDLTGRDTPGHYIQHTVFFREKPLTGCIGFEIFLMGWGGTQWQIGVYCTCFQFPVIVMKNAVIATPLKRTGSQ